MKARNRTAESCLFLALLGAGIVAPAPAQQVSDLEFQPAIARPAYPAGAGPRVAIDEGHHNFHTRTGRYQPFANLLGRDGYRVVSHAGAFSAESLRDFAVLVIANPLHERNQSNWTRPTPSAFTPGEISAVRAWVAQGGALFLIADHMPFPGAAGELARAFGFEFSNGFAGHSGRPSGAETFTFERGLRESAVTRGRGPAEAVSRVTTFTGSAFRPPPAATPVLVLGDGWESLEPEKAWDFRPDTPKIPVAGWSQGAVLAFERGRIAVFGEAAMFSAQRGGAARTPMGFNSPSAPQNVQFLLNVLHWLSRVEGMGE